MREHSCKELRVKLASRGYSGEAIEQVLRALAEKGLQSDRRFAEGYTVSRVCKGYGPLRIRAELRERGLEDSLIGDQLECYTTEWSDLLQRVHDQKYGSQPAIDRREIARRARFLEYRGFPGEMIGRLLFDND